MPAAAMAGAMLPRRVSSIAAARGGVVLTVRVVNPLLSCSLRPVDFTLDRSVDVVVVRPRSLFRRRRGCRPLGQVRVLFYPDRVPSAINTLTNKRVTNSQGEFFSLSLSPSLSPPFACKRKQQRCKANRTWRNFVLSVSSTRIYRREKGDKQEVE